MKPVRLATALALVVLTSAGQAQAADSRLPLDNMRCLAASVFVAEGESDVSRAHAHFRYYLGRIDEASPGQATVKRMRDTLRSMTPVDLLAEALRCKQAYEARDDDLGKLAAEIGRWLEREEKREERKNARQSFHEDDER